MENENRVDMQRQPLTRLEPTSLCLHGMCFKPLGLLDTAFDGFLDGKKQCLSLMTLYLASIMYNKRVDVYPKMSCNANYQPWCAEIERRALKQHYVI